MEKASSQPIVNAWTVAAVALEIFYYGLDYVGIELVDYYPNEFIGFVVFQAPVILAIISFFRPQTVVGHVISALVTFMVGGLGLFALFGILAPQQ